MNNNKILTVYLAGAIESISKDEATDWRNLAIKRLALMRLIGVCPIIHGIEFNNEKPFTRTIEQARDIFETDLDLIMRCDAILVNFEHHSVGTSQELFFATQVLGIPSFVYGDDKILSSSFTQSTTTFRCDDMVDAILHIKDYNAPNISRPKQYSYISNRNVLERINSRWS